MRGNLFFRVVSDRMRGHVLKLHKMAFGLDIRRNLFTGRAVKCWNRLPSQVVQSPSLEGFKSSVDVALVDMA